MQELCNLLLDYSGMPTFRILVTSFVCYCWITYNFKNLVNCFVYYFFSSCLVLIFSIFLYIVVALSIITSYAVKTKLISSSTSLNYVLPFVLVLAALRAKGRQRYYLDNLQQLIRIVRWIKINDLLFHGNKFERESWGSVFLLFDFLGNKGKLYSPYKRCYMYVYHYFLKYLFYYKGCLHLSISVAYPILLFLIFLLNESNICRFTLYREVLSDP